uniref:ShKT domain-containing protein n=1 Tax=Meloidogyne javanica TaxID=6303 RepID=A0A915MC27_MELJA
MGDQQQYGLQNGGQQIGQLNNYLLMLLLLRQQQQMLGGGSSWGCYDQADNCACIGGECPPDCPVVCTCVARIACCTTQNGTNGGGSISSNLLLTRLLLALLLSSPRSNIGGPRARLSLVLCRDLALNCALYTFYCALPVYALCMRANCAATCGLCNDGGGLLGMPLLLSLLGFDGLTGNTRNPTVNTRSANVVNPASVANPPSVAPVANPVANPPVAPQQQPSSPNTAIRAGAPPIREESVDEDSNNFANISIQNSFPINNFASSQLSNNRRNLNNNPIKFNIQPPLKFAIPPDSAFCCKKRLERSTLIVGSLILMGGGIVVRVVKVFVVVVSR